MVRETRARLNRIFIEKDSNPHSYIARFEQTEPFSRALFHELRNAQQVAEVIRITRCIRCPVIEKCTQAQVVRRDEMGPSIRVEGQSVENIFQKESGAGCVS